MKTHGTVERIHSLSCVKAQLQRQRCDSALGPFYSHDSSWSNNPVLLWNSHPVLERKLTWMRGIHAVEVGMPFTCLQVFDV